MTTLPPEMVESAPESALQSKTMPALAKNIACPQLRHNRFMLQFPRG